MPPAHEVNWLTVVTTLIVGLPAILVAAGGLLVVLMNIYKELKRNTEVTTGTAVQVKEELVKREAKVDSKLEEAKEQAKHEATAMATKALVSVKDDIAGIAETINGHTDKRVEDARQAGFIEGKKANSDEELVKLHNALVAVVQWQEQHGELDEKNMSEIREKLNELGEAIRTIGRAGRIGT